jgi:hypothetical protein
MVTSHQMTLSGLQPNTEYVYRLRSVDAGGAVGRAGAFRFTTQPPDTTPPTASVTSPTTNQTVSGTITVRATAADNVGVAGVTLLVDGAAVGAEDTKAPYEFQLNTVSYSNGTHSIVARARDAAGNQASSTAVPVTVSNEATGPQFYVSPTATATGTGTITNPWRLQTALNQPAAVVAGSTIWLRGGTYSGRFVSWLVGAAGAPVTVRQYPGERAVIDGAAGSGSSVLELNGRWAVYRDFEVTSSSPSRFATVPNVDLRPTGINVYSGDLKLVNLVVHDTGNGVGFWEAARDSELYGCLLYNNGWVASNDRGAGHGVYFQNRLGTKRLADNVVLNNFGFGFHAYSEGGYTIGLRIEGNAAFNNGAPAFRGESGRFTNLLVGTTTNPADDVQVAGNHLYHPPGSSNGPSLRLGYGATNLGAEVRDNYVVGGSLGLYVQRWAEAVVTGNTFYVTAASGEYAANVQMASGAQPSAYVWDGNRYYDAVSPGGSDTFVYAGQYRVYSSWRSATGWDASSQYAGGRPAGVEVFVRPNAYEAGRATVVVYNWDGAATASADLGGVLEVGQAYEVRRAEDWHAAPVLTGTYAGGSLTLPLAAGSVARPVGFPFTPASVAPEFNVFIILPR